MSIKSIEIKNLLSFENLKIEEVNDINCVVGQNNVGKSNLLKILKFFYGKMEGKRELPPELYSNYDPIGFIKLEFDTELIHRIVRNRQSPYFEKISKTLFNESNKTKKITAAEAFNGGRSNKKITKKRISLSLII